MGVRKQQKSLQDVSSFLSGLGTFLFSVVGSNFVGGACDAMKSECFLTVLKITHG